MTESFQDTPETVVRRFISLIVRLQQYKKSSTTDARKRQVAEEQHQVALTINNLQPKLISNHYLLYLMAKYSSTLT